MQNLKKQVDVKKMKISMWIPKSKEPSWIRKFIQNEMSEAKNIKSRETRNSTIQSLRIALNNARRGACIFADGNEFTIEHYDDRTFFYRCGREFIKPSIPENYK